jgi:hypothetical protein
MFAVRDLGCVLAVSSISVRSALARAGRVSRPLAPNDAGRSRPTTPGARRPPRLPSPQASSW